MSESDVYRRQILTFNDDLRAVRVNLFHYQVVKPQLLGIKFVFKHQDL